MKFLSTIRYILFALIILGYFANFAQNEYGFDIINNGVVLVALTWLANVVLMGKEMWKGRKVLIMMCSTIIFFLGSILLIVIYTHYPKEVDIEIAALGGLGVFVFLPTLLIMLVIIARINQKRNLTYGKLSVIQFFAFFLFFWGFYAKLNYSAGANAVIIFSGGMIVLVMLRRLIGVVFRNTSGKHRGSSVLIAFYVNVILALLAIVFNQLHYPGSFLLLVLSILSAIISTLVWIFRHKFATGYSESFGVKRPALTFVLIYFNYVVMILWLTSINVLPPSYTLHSPFALKKLREQSANPKTDSRVLKYEDSYETFVNNRKVEVLAYETQITI